ncbi:MAG: hypothetical protein QM757_23860 [Paludibaculum sp.]
MNQLFRQTIAEVLSICFGAQIGEWEYGDAGSRNLLGSASGRLSPRIRNTAA